MGTTYFARAKAKPDSNFSYLRSISLKIAEYTGLSEYESKVYLSLISW